MHFECFFLRRSNETKTNRGAAYPHYVSPRQEKSPFQMKERNANPTDEMTNNHSYQYFLPRSSRIAKQVDGLFRRR